MKRMSIEGDVVTIVWSASSPRYDIPPGTEPFVVRDGRIMMQAFAAHRVSKRR